MAGYKVFIPSAGTGSRIGSKLNKALTTLGDKPAISYIIDKIPEDVPIVVAIGYQGEILKDFLEIAYPNRDITTFRVSKYEGDQSGLGITLLEAQPYLKDSPFIFCSNDTIVNEIPIPSVSYLGFSHSEDNTEYRSVKLVGGHPVELLPKGINHTPAYIGLVGICRKDVNLFWAIAKNLSNDPTFIRVGEAEIVRRMLPNIHAIKVEWHDIGNPIALTQARIKYPGVCLPKENEATWFIDNAVIKYHDDPRFIENRVIRAKALKNYVPEIIETKTHFYKYNWINGAILSSVINVPIFERLLDTLGEFWGDSLTDKSNIANFYREKTWERWEDFRTRFEYTDKAEVINGMYCPAMEDILSSINWDWLNGELYRFHGDLHFENIVYNVVTKRFTLLDWRQDFAGLCNEMGDIYYDFAKLNHGLIVSHEQIQKNNYHYKVEPNGDVDVGILVPEKYIELQQILKKYVDSSGFEWDVVELLTYLIFLNSAPLHHYPYSHFLFHFAKYKLGQLLK